MSSAFRGHIMVLVQRVLLLSLIAQLLHPAEGDAGEAVDLQNLVDEYVDTYHRLHNETTTPYDRLESLANDAEKLLVLSETLGTTLVNGSLGYTQMDDKYKSSIRFHASGYSSQFARLHNFFNDEKWEQYVTSGSSDNQWERYFGSASAKRHGCRACFPDTQDKLDVLTPLMSRLLKQLGVYFKQVQSYYTKYGKHSGEDNSDFYFALRMASEGNSTGGFPALRLAERCDLFNITAFRYCEDGVECSVQIVNDIMGNGCEDSNATTIREAGSIRRMYEDDGSRSQLPGVASNKCFHNFLIRNSSYSADVYESFVNTLGRYLLLELDMFGFCSPIAEVTEAIANLSDRRRKMHEATRGIAKKLLEGKQLLEVEGAGKSKSWTQLAHEVARSAIDVVAKGKDLPYPSSDDAMETYKEIGESIGSFPFNTETFALDNVVYHPALDDEDHCVLKYNNDTVEEVRHKNVNYVVSRCRKYYHEVGYYGYLKERCGIIPFIMRTQPSHVNKTIPGLFAESAEKNICERIKEVESRFNYNLFGENGFGTVVVVKCARKFVWLELAWKHFRSAWSTSQYQYFVNNGTYGSACALIVFMP